MKRWILIFIVFALIGAVINVLVAWTCVLSDAIVLDYDGGKWVNISESHRYSVLGGEAFGQEYELRGYFVRSDDEYVKYETTELRAGWPLRSLKWYQHGPATVETSETWFYRQPDDPGMSLRTPPAWTSYFHNPKGYERLPTAPIWLGLVYNSSLFGVIAFLLVLGLPTRRRILRRLRHQCLHCGYPRSDSSRCTECGVAAPAPK